jgi:hypothetical protein
MLSLVVAPQGSPSLPGTLADYAQINLDTYDPSSDSLKIRTYQLV